MAGQVGGRTVANYNSGGSVADLNPVSAASLKHARQERRGEAKIGSAHVVIVFTLFLVLFAATLLVGGHAAVDSLVQAATAPQQDPRSAGAVVYTMPDGVFCRHVSFDNVTAQVREGSIERCVDDHDISKARARPSGSVTWGSN